MVVILLIVALVGCLGLVAALWPGTFTRYFLAQAQRRALAGNFKAVSFTGWIIFSVCMIAVLAFALQRHLHYLVPFVAPLLFLVCAVVYLWWGLGLLRHPASFLRRATKPWSRAPVWAVRVFGALLLLGAVALFYGFAAKVVAMLR